MGRVISATVSENKIVGLPKEDPVVTSFTMNNVSIVAFFKEKSLSHIVGTFERDFLEIHCVCLFLNRLYTS